MTRNVCLRAPATLLLLLAASSLPALAAAQSCVGDTTGPFTPYACIDAEEPAASASWGPLSGSAAAGDESVSATATIGHAFGETTLGVSSSTP